MSYIVVVGSVNMDLVVRTEWMPKAGETVKGESFSTIPGGKGANQAVAVSRMGGAVKMVGAIGLDSFGRELKRSLESAGVDITNVVEKDGVTTGTAFIIVDQAGDNRIISVPGANGRFLPEDVDNVESLIAGADIVIMQFEIPIRTIEYVTQLAARHAIPVILNPAPAYFVPDALLKKVSVLIVNESEAELFSGCPVVDINSGFLAAEILRVKGIETVIVTLGKRGALTVRENLRFHAPAREVEVVDTTAAGDTFVGAFAVARIEGKEMEEALELAVAAGTLSVTRFGAQPSIPTRQDVQQFLQLQGAHI